MIYQGGFMKKSICLWVLSIVILSFMAVSCAKHVSPVAVEEPVIEEIIGSPTLNITLSPAASATATSTGSITASYTPTNTHTSTNTLSATATSTATNTTGHGYRLKTMNVSNSGVIGMEMTLSYGAGGLTPSAASITTFDSSGLPTFVTNAGYDFLGNTSSMSVRDSSGNLVQTLVSTLSGGKVSRTEVFDSTGTLLEYAEYQYDSADRIIRTDGYDASGVLQCSEVKTYNAAGSELTVEKYSGAVQTERIVNTYNASGQKVRTEKYISGVLDSYEVMDYDGAGKMILVTSYNSANIVTCTSTYTYNSVGEPDEVHALSSFMGMSMTMDTYYIYNAQSLLIEVNGTQSIGGIPAMTLSSVMTYEPY